MRAGGSRVGNRGTSRIVDTDKWLKALPAAGGPLERLARVIELRSVSRQLKVTACTAPQSEVTKPLKPIWSRRIVVRLSLLPQAKVPLRRL